ncbi:MAG: sensor histidine kinase, partial [Actinomycetota bacterium]
ANAEDIVRLIINLVDNALRHGGTPVTISAFNQDDDVVITVTDHGPGLPPTGPELIFDRFYRGDASRPAGGTGLGLAIARGLAEQHGGTLTAANAPEGGAVFTLRLPRS